MEKKSKAVAVSADLIKIESAQGKSREEFFADLMSDDDKYKDLKLTKKQAEKVRKVYRKYSTGLSAAVPLRCTGQDCPFASTCPYWEMGKVVVGEECKFEHDLVIFYTKKFMEEFDVDPDNFSEVMLISELAELNIYEIRLSKTLGMPENARLIRTEYMLTESGAEIEVEKPHTAWTIKERIKGRRMKILEALVATRKEKLKAAAGLKGDERAASTINDLKDKIDRLMNQNRIPADIVAEDADFTEE